MKIATKTAALLLALSLTTVAQAERANQDDDLKGHTRSFRPTVESARIIGRVPDVSRVVPDPEKAELARQELTRVLEYEEYDALVERRKALLGRRGGRSLEAKDLSFIEEGDHVERQRSQVAHETTEDDLSLGSLMTWIGMGILAVLAAIMKFRDRH